MANHGKNESYAVKKTCYMFMISVLHTAKSLSRKGKFSKEVWGSEFCGR